MAGAVAQVDDAEANARAKIAARYTLTVVQSAQLIEAFMRRGRAYLGGGYVNANEVHPPLSSTAGALAAAAALATAAARPGHHTAAASSLPRSSASSSLSLKVTMSSRWRIMQLLISAASNAALDNDDMFCFSFSRTSSKLLP